MNRPTFFNAIRGGFTGKLEPDEVKGTEAVLDAMAGLPLAWTAYALGTAFHETAGTMQPINERGGAAYFHARYDPNGARPDIAKRLGNTEPGDGARYHGRGFVQLTGRANYKRAGDELAIDLIRYPDQALECGVASRIMRFGMVEGWFTGKSFAAYLPHGGAASYGAFVLARRIINGSDRAADIATYAQGYQAALKAGGWA
ncbi:MAG: glycoside hydrolase family 19 protein [Polynucleobacter sp.]